MAKLTVITTDELKNNFIANAKLKQTDGSKLIRKFINKFLSNQEKTLKFLEN